MADWNQGKDDYLSEDEALENAELVAEVLKDGWDKKAISAIIGNMWEESSVNPHLYEQGYGHSMQKGFGLLQWTPAMKLKDWADSNGEDWTDGEGQLARLNWEIDNDEQWVADGHSKRYGKESKFDFSFNAFRKNKDDLSVEELTEAFMWNYEGPDYEAGKSSLEGRKEFAGKVYDLDFDGETGGKIWFEFPVPDPYRITQEYKPGKHFGIDIAGENPGDTPDIQAIAKGKVSRSYKSDSYGNVVFIVHKADGKDWEAVYAHLSERKVSVGDSVNQGDTIGVMGNTGHSEGVHLHFELHQPSWKDDKADSKDPEDYLDVKFGEDYDDKDDSDDIAKRTMELMLVGALGGFVYDKFKKG